MTDVAAPALDGETPVNPYRLLEAINRASRSASLAWLALLALMAYLWLAVASVSHRDLLLDSDVVLPIFQSKIGLSRFFVVAPLVLVGVHFGVIGQLALLARKSLEFAGAVRLLEVSDARTHPLRYELDTFFLVQAIAGPERSRVISGVLNGLGWLTVVLLPLLLLLFIQVTFLPYHAVAITMLHRLAVLADLLLLLLVGIFLVRAETSFFRAVVRAGRQHALGLVLASVGVLGVAAASLLVATVPGEPLDRADLLGLTRLEAASAASPRLGAAAPLFGATFGMAANLWPRNLVVSDLDLTTAKAPSGGVSINLRGRDLRFARFDRSNLRRADLSGADLEGASLIEADLREASLQCVELSSGAAGEAPATAACTHAERANLARARLTGAKLSGIDLSQANLEAAELSDAQLDGAVLSGANLSQAALVRANLVGAQLRAATIAGASLQGADLSRAQLQLADFSDAKMQAADLSTAALEGARLFNAELEGANLSHSALYAVDLTGARLAGADLTAAAVWQTAPPESGNAALAELTDVSLSPPGDQRLAELTALALRHQAALRPRRGSEMTWPDSATEVKAWAASAEHQAWQGLGKPRTATETDTYKARLTAYLNRLVCQARWADGAVAAGVAKRAMTPGFKGDLTAIFERMRSADCPASAQLAPRLLQALEVAVELARVQD